MKEKVMLGQGALVQNDREMPYPRLCAHRGFGFSTVAPENSMPAFGAAVAMGAEEIEFDLWYTKDDEIVSIHDDTLSRVSNGQGFVFEHTLAELQELDFGSIFSEAYRGMSVLTFEEILKKFAGHVIMNIHIKARKATSPYERKHMQKIIDLIDRYDCRAYVYFMSENDNILRLAQEMAPDITRCVGYNGKAENMIPRALAYDCRKIQLYRPYFDQAMVDEAREKGIICNVCWSDGPEDAIRYFEMGIGCVLSNNFGQDRYAVDKYLKSRK